MNNDGGRQRRVSEQIQKELALLIQQEMKDPRVQWVTVSAVEVTRDYSYAKVFVTALTVTEDPKAADTIMSILKHAAGFLRRELSKRMSLRSVPELVFVYDVSMENGNRISRLIEAAKLSQSSAE